MHRGTCLCEAVTFEVDGPLPPPDACHCNQCRKFSGHYFVSSDVAKESLTIHGADKLNWFTSPKKAVRRGFCSVCGSSLFWEPLEHDWIGIAMGALDNPSQTHIAVHIYTAEKGDYYTLSDGVPQKEHH